MSETKINLNFKQNSYFLAKKGLFGGRRISLTINGNTCPNSYLCKDDDEFNSLIEQIKSLATLLNSNSVFEPIDYISKAEVALFESEEFQNIRFAFSGQIEFSGTYPDITLYVHQGYPGYKLKVKANGFDILCSLATFNFATRKLDIRGLDQQQNRRKETIYCSSQQTELLRKIIRIKYLNNIEWVTRFMNFSISITDDTIEKALSEGLLKQ